MDELATVFSYPFSDKMAYVLLAVFVGVFSVASSLAAFGAGLAILLSQGLLYAYTAFTAINRVSVGDLKGFMPNVGDIGDLIQPDARRSRGTPHQHRTAAGAGRSCTRRTRSSRRWGAPAPGRAQRRTRSSSTPSLSPGELQALREEAAAGNLASAGSRSIPKTAWKATGYGRSRRPPVRPRGTGRARRENSTSRASRDGCFAAFVLAVLWKILYSPVALVAAAISRGFFATLNPLGRDRRHPPDGRHLLVGDGRSTA